MKKVNHLNKTMYLLTSENFMNPSSASMANYLSSNDGNESNYYPRNANVSDISNNNNNTWQLSMPQNISLASSQSFNQPFITPSPSIRFTASPTISTDILSPDPCTSQTATEWEMLNKLSSTNTGNYSHHCLKRKNSSDEEDDENINQLSNKQYIGEDKFADKFNEMSINNQQINSNLLPNLSQVESLSSENYLMEEIMTDIDEDASEENKEKNSQIVISDEIKQVIKTENMLDDLIREELNKNSRAVVLWQPLINPILQKIDLRSSKKRREEDSLDYFEIKSKKRPRISL